MGDALPALVFGGILILLAAGSAWRYRRPVERNQLSDELAFRHARRQRRLRLQISAMVGLVGVLIPLGDQLPWFRRAPVAFVLFWGAILLLVAWIVLLGLADMAATRMYFNRADHELSRGRRRLEEELSTHRHRNGVHSDE